MMNEPTHTLCAGVYSRQDIDEFWETDNEDEVVLITDRRAFLITVKEVPMPELTPAAWMNGEGPHPFGFTV